MIERRLSIAPMLEWTDRYYRYFARLITRHTLLYTEMITTGALLRGDSERFLAFHPSEHPVALQLGGNDPADLALSARLGEQHGYDEINLNVGCPSDRVQNGRFGAALMADPALVADCVRAMRGATALPVTVKHRIGIDHLDSYQLLHRFVATVAEAGCDTFIVHARKAWLSPKQNREIPPLDYPLVHRLKRDFPALAIVINGGITTLDQAAEQLQWVDGVMIGREAYHNPWILAEADRRLFGDHQPRPTRHQVLHRLMPMVEQALSTGVPLTRISRHLLGLFHGQPGARAWRRMVSEQAHLAGAGCEVLERAAALVAESD